MEDREEPRPRSERQIPGMPPIVCDCCDYGPCARQEMKDIQEKGSKWALEQYMNQVRKRSTESFDDAEQGKNAKRKCHNIGAPAEAMSHVDSPDQTTAIVEANRFINSDRTLSPMFFMMGPKGCGKTVAAAFVLFHFAKRFDWNGQPTGSNLKPFLWVDARSLTNTPTFGDDQAGWIASIKKASLVVFDDIGDEGSENGCNMLAGLLAHRIDHHLRSVITTNILPAAISKRYGQALTDRLKTKSIIPVFKEKDSLRRPFALKKMP